MPSDPTALIIVGVALLFGLGCLVLMKIATSRLRQTPYRDRGR